MRTVVLDDEIERISKATEPIRNQWKKFGCSILSDGWSDTRRRSIINILVSSCLGTYFLRAVDAGKGGKSITGEFIFRHIRQAIIDVGAENIVQVIIDNASNCVAMGKMVEEEFPTICWTPCASHCLDLLIEDIAKLPWINRVMNEARQIVLFFRRKHKALSILREFTDLEVICPSKTRFAYMFIVLERLNLLHDHLRQAVVSHMWIQWNESNLPESQSVQRACLDFSLWVDVKAIVNSLRPLFILLRLTDMEGCTLGLLYHFMQKLLNELDNIQSLEACRYLSIDLLKALFLIT